MGSQQCLWTALESVPGLCAVGVEWRALLGDEFEAASMFLRPDGRQALSHPCTSRPACGCGQHDVVCHGPGDIVSVCRCDPPECDTAPLTEADVVLYEVNRRTLGDAVAAALGVTPEHAVAANVHMTWSIGVYSPTAGFRFPVYLTVQIEPDDLRRVVDALVARAEGPFLLVGPTRRLFKASCVDPLRRVKAHFLALADDFALDAGGSIRALRPTDEVLKPFISAVLPASRDAPRVAFFPTPPDAAWEAVQIKFRDGHTVSVRVGDARGVFNFAQMGMADGKSGNPTKQWDLLRVFAMRHGQLDWTSRDADRKNQKRKEILSSNLRAFFRIEGEPFEVIASVGGEGKGWRSRFALDPDE